MNPSVHSFLKSQTMLRCCTLLAVCLGLNQASIFSQTIFNYTNAASGAPAFVAPNASGSSLALGAGVSSAGLTCVGPTDGFGADGWPSTNIFDVAAFNASGDYFTFTLTPDAGYGLKITGFSTRSRRENVGGVINDGPIAMRYGYSTDGGTTWTTVNPGNPQSSNICASSGVFRDWVSFGTVNASAAVIFRVYGLSSGTSGMGDLVLHDVVVSGDVCANTPSMSPAPSAFSVCSGTTSTDYSYMFKDAIVYTVNYDMAAESEGFVDVSTTNVPDVPGPITLSVPANAAPGTYNAIMTVRNSCGFATNYNFTITINPLPMVSCPSNTTVCLSDMAFALSGEMPGGGTYSGAGVSAGTFDPVAAGVGTHTITYTYTDGNSCTNNCTFSITVNPISATANVGDDQYTCVDGIIQISGGIMGAPGTGTWTASIGGGSFSPSATSLDAYYTPPPGNTDPITLTLTPDGQCVASDNLEVTYGPLDPLVLEMTGPTEATCGDEVTFNVEVVSGFSAMASLQYAVSWDEAELMYIPPVVAPSIGIDAPGTSNLPSNQINYVWFASGASGENLGGGTNLLSLTFKVIGNSGVTSLSITDIELYSPIEATNAQFCMLDVAVSGANLTINPIEVTCPGNLTVCLNDEPFALTGGMPVGGDYSGPGVLGNSFDPASAGVGTHAITYSYTNPDGCSNDCSFDITVVPLPDITASDKSICTGGNTDLEVTNPNMLGGTFNWVADYGDVTGGAGSGTGVAYGLGAIDETLVNNTADPIVVTYALIPVGPDPSNCVGSFFNVYVTVEPAPMFGFTATTTSGGSEAGNNSAGPTTINANFCAGDLLTLEFYSDNGDLGFLGSYTSTGNTTSNGVNISAGPVSFDVLPNAVADFFDNIYGGALGYDLSSGNSGTITQIFTPYIDINGNNAYDLGVDCLGEPITLMYNIYAIPTITSTPLPDPVCNNTQVTIEFDGNFGGAATYSWTNDNPAIGLPANGSGNIDFTAVNAGMADLVANISVTPMANGCSGTPLNFSITVHPEPVVSISATVDGGTIQTGSNAGGPATIELVFCSGQSFMHSAFMSTPGVSFMEEIVAGTTNLLYNGNPIMVPRLPTSIPAAGAAAFFAGTYGPYGLAPGETYGWMDQVYTPFYDVNGDGIFDAGIDCWGEPITIHYAVYAPISLSITQNNPNEVCSGTQLDYSITTTSTQDVVFDLILEANPNGNNQADLTDDNTLPSTIFGLVVNDTTPYNFLQVLNNAVGTFDRGRVNIRATNIRYEDADVCGPTADVTSTNTRVYPKPILTDPGDKVILSGSPVDLMFDPLSGTPSLDIPTAGYPVRIDWTAVATGGVTGFSPSGSTIIYDANGLLNLSSHIPDVLSLPLANCEGSVTYTITPVSDGPNPGGGFDAAFCSGDPFDVVVTVRPEMVLTSSVVGSSEVACGDEITIQVAASGFCNVGSLDYYFSWDNSVFELVTFTTPYSTPDGTFDLFQPNSNELYLTFFDNDYSDGFGTDIPSGSVILTYTLRAIGPAGIYSPVPTVILEEASDIDFEPIPLSSTSVPIEIIPLSLMSVGPIAPVCPSDPFANLPFSGVVGTPTEYVIDYDAAAQMAGFPPMVSGTLDLMAGHIVLVVPPGLQHGLYNGTLIVFNEYGCESDPYNFVVTVDQTPPTASNPAPISQACMPAPAPNPLVVTDEMDNCPGPLSVVWVEDLDNGGSGCGITPKIITRIYRVTDVAGNTTTVTQTITMLDNIPPTVSTAGMATWYSDEAAAVAAAMAIANDTKLDNCSPPNGITVVQGNPVDYYGCSVTIHLIVSDACGNIADYFYTTVIDSEPPTADVTPIDDCYEPSEEVNPYGDLQYAVEAALLATIGNDDCTDPEDLIYTVTTSGGHCELTIYVTITDGCGKSTTVSYVTRIDGTGPIITALPDALSIENGNCFETVEDAEAAALAVTMANVGDDCGDPSSLQFDVFTSGGCPAEIMVFVTDYCGNPSLITYTDVHIDNEAPVVPPAFDYASCFQSQAAAFAALIAEANPTDNCTSYEDLIASADAVFVEDSPNDDCMEGTVTITFTDRCGHSTSIDFIEIIIDNVAPEFVSLPLVDANYNCVDDVDAPDAGAVVGSDNCSESVSATWEGDVLPTSCPGILYRTYRLTDYCGNTADFVQEIMVSDDELPVWTTAEGTLDRLYSCDDPDFVDAFLEAPTAGDNCGEVVLVKTTGAFVASQDCPHEGTYTNTWTATDLCNNMAATVFTQVITIIDNTIPVVNFNCQFMPALELTTASGADCPPDADISLEVGETISPLDNWFVAGVQIANLEFCVTDNCSSLEEITVTLVNVTYEEDENYPDGCSKLITATFQIADACGNAADPFVCEYLIIDNTAPVWSTPEGQPFPYGIDVALSCSDVDALAFANSLVPAATDNCPGDVTIEKSAGVFVPGGDCPSEGTITNTFIAYDACGMNNPSVVFTQVISLFDNEAPTFSPGCQFMPLTLTTEDGYDCPIDAELNGLVVDQIIDINTNWNVAGFNVPTLSGCIFDNCADPATIIIKVLSIENVYDPEACDRTITVSFELSDPCGNVQEEAFVCIYHIIDNTAPEILCVLRPGGGGPEIEDCYATVAAAEADALEALTPCDNCTPSEDLVMTVSTIGTCNAEVTVTVSDCAGNTSSYTFFTRIDGTGPVLTQGTIPSCFVNTTDAEAAAMAATTSIDNCPGGLNISASTVGTCPASVTVTVTDGCGNASSVVYENICIGAGNSVTISTPASDQTVDCSNEAAGLAAWLANHGGAVAMGSGVVWTYTPDPIVFGPIDCMTHSKSVTVTFKATDNCGYMATTTATFTVQDLTPPSVAPVATTNLTCSTQIPAPDLNLVTGVSDNCDATPTIALFSNTSNGGAGCPMNPLELLRTYSVTDAYCNTTYVTHTVIIVDNVPPTFTAPGNITINVNASCVYDASTAVTGDVFDENDNCSGMLNATYVDVVTPGVQNQDKFIITRTWELKDNCGNGAQPLTQIITVKDVTPPTINCPAAVYQPGGPVENNSCGWTVSGLTPTFDDNCDGESLSYTLSGFFTGNSAGVGSVDGRLFLEGETTVTYTVTDAVGNTATCSFVVTVNCTTISGRIIWEHDKSTGVKDATVRLTFGMLNLGSNLSDVAGEYSLTSNVLGTHTITPVKNINRFNGVTAADATAIQQHISGTNVITDPYKKVAADVNRNGFITSQDANLILQGLAGNGVALNIFNVFWRFVPTTHLFMATPPTTVPTFPENITVNVTGPDVTGQDFYGMKIGDVNGSADPSMAPTGTPLTWILKDQMLQAGAEVALNFTSTNFTNLAAIQFGLDFDPEYLQFVGFESTDAITLSAENFGDASAAFGELRFVWAQATGTTLPDGTPVMKAKFKVLKGGQKLSKVVKLDEQILQGRAYTEALVASEVRVVFVESVATGDPANMGKLGLQLFQNNPNPFAGATTIGFILPDACEAQLRVLDASGRELTNYKRNYSAGYHEIDFRMDNAAAYGVLYYELTTPFGKLTKKMVTIK